MNRRQRIIVSVTGIFIVLLILIGLTYAYFLTRITGNSNPTSISVTTANLELVYGDGTTSILTSATPIEPGKFSSSKDFTVTNNGNALTEYAVTLEDFSVIYANDTVIDGVSVKAGTVTKMEYPGDMKMTITCTIESEVDERNGKSCGSKEGTLPTENSILLVNSIEKGDTHKYVLTLTYIDSGKDQSVDMNKTIKGKIDIIDPKSTIDVTGTVINYQTGDYVEINSTPIKSEIVDGKYKLIGVEPGSHTLYVKYKDVSGDVQTRGSQTLTIKKGKDASVSGNTITFTDASREATVDVNSDYTLSIDEEIKEYKYFYDNILKSIAHRGYNLVAPENTIPSYELAKNQGFNYVEADVRFTSDGVPVLLHDATINRTARMSDGSKLAETINIADITYEEVLNYDFGIWKNEAYAGTKIPTFEDFLSFCKSNNLNPYIDVQMSNLTETQINTLVELTKKYQLKNVTWVSTNFKYLNWFNKYFPSSNLGFVTWKDDELSYGITELQKLKTDYNRVFLNVDYSLFDLDAAVSACKDADIPLEVYATGGKLTKTEIEMLDPYITGVTHDYLIAGKVLYEGTNAEIVKVLSSSQIKYGAKTAFNYPYYNNDSTRASYVDFDIILEEGYTYKFEFESSIESAQMGVQLSRESAGPIIYNKGTIPGYPIDSGWISLGSSFEYTIIPSTDSAKYARFAFRLNESNDTITEDFINSVTISRY